jgi:hypothetical protein
MNEMAAERCKGNSLANGISEYFEGLSVEAFAEEKLSGWNPI